MEITSAQYYKIEAQDEVRGIKVTIGDREWCADLSNDSRIYREVMRQVEAGTLTIADAE